MNEPKLYFARGNAKLGKHTLVFSLPAGHTCPGADKCLSKCNRQTGKITDGKDCQFRCYATSAECLFPNIRQSRWQNFELLRKARTTGAMAELLEREIKRHRRIKLVRFHQSGDFFSQAYFDAWVLVASRNPGIIFYGYTKAIPYWAKSMHLIPANMHIVASLGGKFDAIAIALKLRKARVVGADPAESPEAEAKRLGLEIDHDDSLVWGGTKDFAIALHGTQPAGSVAGKAWHQIKTKGRGGYKADYFGHYKKSSK